MQEIERNDEPFFGENEISDSDRDEEREKRQRLRKNQRRSSRRLSLNLSSVLKREEHASASILSARERAKLASEARHQQKKQPRPLAPSPRNSFVDTNKQVGERNIISLEIDVEEGNAHSSERENHEYRPQPPHTHSSGGLSIRPQRKNILNGAQCASKSEDPVNTINIDRDKQMSVSTNLPSPTKIAAVRVLAPHCGTTHASPN